MIRVDAAGFEFVNVMLNDTLRNRNHACQIGRTGATFGLEVANVRSSVCFRPQPKKENVNTARLPVLRLKAFHFVEERSAEQSFEVTYETEVVVHAHRRQRILREDIQTAKQVIKLICLCLLSNKTMQRLRTASAENHNRQVAGCFARCHFNFTEHRTTNLFLGFEHFIVQSMRRMSHSSTSSSTPERRSHTFLPTARRSIEDFEGTNLELIERPPETIYAASWISKAQDAVAEFRRPPNQP